MQTFDAHSTRQRCWIRDQLSVWVAVFAVCGFVWSTPSQGAAQGAPSVRGSSGFNQTGDSQRLQRRDLPEYYVVQEEETLWDLAARFYGDEREWPRLWSYNPHITNPHYIYPGDIVYLSPPPEPQERKKTDKQKPPQDEGPDKPVVKDPKTTAPGLHLAAAGFIDKETPKLVGRVIASPKNARLLGQYDEVWVGFGDAGYTQNERDSMRDKNIRDLQAPDDVQKGDRFAVVEVGDELTNEQGDVIGTKYFVTGSIRITETSEEHFQTAEVEQSWREFQRGAFLIPYGRQLRAITTVPAETDLVGNVIGGIPPKFHYGQFDYVFINRGASDGVRIGNRMYVYRQSEGLKNEWEATSERIPWRRVARLRVVDITEDYATAWVTDSSREFNVGDRVEMYDGN